MTSGIVAFIAIAPIFVGMAVILMSYVFESYRVRDVATNFVTCWICADIFLAVFALGVVTFTE